MSVLKQLALDESGADDSGVAMLLNGHCIIICARHITWDGEFFAGCEGEGS